MFRWTTFRFILSFFILAVSLIVSIIFTMHYSRYICSKPDRHCMGERYIRSWEKWWVRFENNHVYVTLTRWIYPERPKRLRQFQPQEETKQQHDQDQIDQQIIQAGIQEIRESGS